ncbi:MAG TPA: hypothetical protein PLV00_07520 [Caldisericia bacterium]|nr:hypothetical protein [Caldisericia bacterium]
MTEEERVRREEELRSQGFDNTTVNSILQAEESEPNKKNNFGKYALYIAGTVVAILFVIVTVALLSATGTDEGPSRYEIDSTKRLIFYTSQEYLKKYLDYPESAEFAPYKATSVNESPAEKGTYIVNSQVHVANVFGVLKPYNYKMMLKEIDKDTYAEIMYDIYK